MLNTNHNNLFNSSTKTVQSCSHKYGCSAQSRWTTAILNPVTFHTTDQSQRSVCNVILLLGKLKLVTETVDVQTRI